MEKRLIIAFLLSYLLILMWSKQFAPAPSPLLQEQATKKAPLNNPSSFFKEKKGTLAAEASLPDDIKKQEKISVLENDKLKIEFSNIGGEIKSVFLKKFNEALPLTDILKTFSEEQPIVFGESYPEEGAVEYSLIKENLKITKRFSLSKDDYLLNAEIIVNGLLEMSKKEEKINGFTLDISRLDKGIDKNNRNLLEYSIYSPSTIYRKNSAFKFTKNELKTSAEPVKWIGFRNRYFCAIIKPLFLNSGYFIVPKDEEHLLVNINIPQNEQLKFVAYFGPQDLDKLKTYKQEFDLIMVFFKNRFLDGIAKLIYYFLINVNKIVHNWGLCIIIVSVIIYGAMYPLTLKGMTSMKKMQAMQPHLNKLKEQYKNNPQKLNKEIMGLYKENKINPLGGCFPLFLQLPIFIGLYQVLWRSVFFKGAHFLWIKDLSEPDRILKFPFTVPALGDYLNILPLIMIVVMAIQQKISYKNMATTDPSQIAQQKMMMTVFPVFLGFLFYNFASGLSLYFTTFYLLSTLSQWNMNRNIITT